MIADADDRDQSTPSSLRATWITAVAAADAESLRPLLTDDYEVWAHAAPPVHGPEAAVLAMRAAMTQYRIAQRFDVIETVVTGEWAFERGVEEMTVTPIAGGTARTMTQRALLILHRGNDGRWRYARGMTNGLPTPTRPNE